MWVQAKGKHHATKTLSYFILRHIILKLKSNLRECFCSVIALIVYNCLKKSSKDAEASSGTCLVHPIQTIGTDHRFNPAHCSGAGLATRLLN